MVQNNATKEPWKHSPNMVSMDYHVSRTGGKFWWSKYKDECEVQTAVTLRLIE